MKTEKVYTKNEPNPPITPQQAAVAKQLAREPLSFAVTKERRNFGQCKSFFPLFTLVSRTQQTQLEAYGVRARSMC